MKLAFWMGITLLMIVGNDNAVGQQEYGKEIVAKLTSKEFKGRGYVGGGDKIAANYLTEKFKEYGLKSFDKSESYFQDFYLDVNTIPNQCEVKINGKTLQLGAEYLPRAEGGSLKGTFSGEWFTKDNFSEVTKRIQLDQIIPEMLIIDAAGIESRDSMQVFHQMADFMATYGPVIWVKDDKFMNTISKSTFKYPIIEIKREFVSKNMQVSIDIETEFVKNYKTQNVIGYLPGKKKDKYLCISAHYDHLGMITQDVVFPGANDNASGVAMLLSLAQHYSKTKPDYTMVFMLFGGEEAGIIGSKHYVNNPLFPLEDIEFLINCDISGTGDEGITVVNGTIHKKQFKKLAKINNTNDYLSKVKVRGRAANSDHFWFSQKQVPAFFIYTMGGIQAYHDIYDKGETLPLTEFTDYHKLLVEFIATF